MNGTNVGHAINLDSNAINLDPLTLSIPNAARRAGVSRSLIYTEIKAGRLASTKLGKRRLIPLEALRDWLDSATSRNI